MSISNIAPTHFPASRKNGWRFAQQKARRFAPNGNAGPAFAGCAKKKFANAHNRFRYRFNGT
jgi:hypothetical protein